MLTRLHISNIALIDKSDIEFDAGFSVLTGETGAGKSILIESVSFVLGDRASRENIRTGASKASVEAEFMLCEDSPAARYLCSRGMDDGPKVILYRELSASGRNVCRINGTLVTASELKELGNLLADLHGQHEHQSLLDSSTHIHLIDAYSEDARNHLEKMSRARSEAIQLRDELKQMRMDLSARMQRIDQLNYQITEIDRISPSDGEEEELETRRNVLRNAEEITDGLNRAYEALFSDGGALSSLSEARESLQTIGRYDPEYRKMSESTDESYYTIEDVAYTLRDARAAFSYNPGELETIESRLASIQNLKRKYGASIREILEYREKIGKELTLLTDSDNQIETKEKAFRTALDTFSRYAEELSESRKRAAKTLCEAAVNQMKDMGMPHARFETGFRRVAASELMENGIDEVEFLLSANRGEPVKPLTKVASGGEISRIMLALKIALSDADRIDTLIFDEIDTGISGMVANAVARKMYDLSRNHQILCVTHLPQIAAYADIHYVAMKTSDEQSTRSTTVRLARSQRAAELARIMGSGTGETEAVAHASRLLEEAEKYRARQSAT